MAVKTTAIERVSSEIKKMKAMATIDLKNPEMVAAMVNTAVEANNAMKVAKEADTEIKNEFKRMCKPYMDEQLSVTCYSFEDESKMTLTPSGGGLVLDEQALIKSIYDMYGEEVGDRSGRAWVAVCSITDAVEVPRIINQEKLEEQLVRASRIENGEEEGTPFVTAEMVNDATKAKAPTYTAKISKMSKSELAAATKGELTEHLVVG